MDHYPFDLDQTWENLMYASSMDEEEPHLHFLYAKFYAEQLQDYRKAVEHFELALLHDPQHIPSLTAFSFLLIHLGWYKRAEKVLKATENIPGFCSVCRPLALGLISEHQGEFKKAKKQYKLALKYSVKQYESEWIRGEIDRVKSKINKKSKKKKSRKKKK
ncbi:hypothetical protein GYB22_13470 [bacterium]|nr:hypothetical protein [bacterium]